MLALYLCLRGAAKWKEPVFLRGPGRRQSFSRVLEGNSLSPGSWKEIVFFWGLGGHKNLLSMDLLVLIADGDKLVASISGEALKFPFRR